MALADQQAPLHSLMFHMNAIQHWTRPGGWASPACHTVEHTLFCFEGGRGTLFLEQQYLSFAQGKCILLPPHVSFQLENDRAEPLFYYQLTFSAFHLHGQTATPYLRPLVPGSTELHVFPFTRLSRLLLELHTLSQESGGPEQFQAQVHFQEIVGLVFQHQQPRDPSADTTKLVEYTIECMQLDYSHPWTVKKLAELADIAQWQYSPIFQALTGQKPLDYLNQLRVEQAKELLRHTHGPLREIALQVGFRDEYYFNRRFRQTTGMTPKQFAGMVRHSRRIKDWTGHEVDIPHSPARIIYHGDPPGDLLALGIQPIGISLYRINQDVYDGKLADMQDVGFPLNTITAAQLEPDLIVFNNSDERQYRHIAKIAPVLTFNCWARLEERLHTLGQWLDRQQEVEDWLARYHRLSEQMWASLRSVIAPGETLTVVTVDHGDRLFVMGTAGIAPAFYHPQGFSPVPRSRSCSTTTGVIAKLPEPNCLCTRQTGS